MAQVWIREFDGKKMFFESVWKKYFWIQVKNLWDIEKLDKNKKYVIKPDMLFGKRWKYWLVWVNLDITWLKNYLEKFFNSSFKLWEIVWNLDVFLVEEFVKHNEEYYISFEWNREEDIVNFSFEWWIEVEENWDKVKTIKVNILCELQKNDLENIWIKDEKIIDLIIKLRKFYKNYWFVYLEINPFCFDEITKEVVLLDMVAKIDDQEFFRQKTNWENLEIPNTFWFVSNSQEEKIKELDKQTWASLKFKILNPQAKIWTLLSWGWWSLVISDSLWALWYSEELWNYWELSWNPSREFTYEYSKILFEEMLKNQIKWKYLIIAWAIANFTDIKKTFYWIIDALKEKKDDFLKQEIKILVRRWWINEKAWLEYFEKECKNMWIYCKIANSDTYMTDILKEIKI